jgi:hypothetical protein
MADPRGLHRPAVESGTAGAVKRFLLVRLALLVPTLLGVLTAIDKRDLPAVQGSILFLSMVFVIVNLVTDILYAKVDPRVAYD